MHLWLALVVLVKWLKRVLVKYIGIFLRAESLKWWYFSFYWKKIGWQSWHWPPINILFSLEVLSSPCPHYFPSLARNFDGPIYCHLGHTWTWIHQDLSISSHFFHSTIIFILFDEMFTHFTIFILQSRDVRKGEMNSTKLVKVTIQ